MVMPSGEQEIESELSMVACENIRFSSLFVAGVPSDEERGETDVFAGYFNGLGIILITR